MNAETWQANNARYLGAALEWVRLRLHRLAQPNLKDASAEQITRAAGGMSELETANPPPALILLKRQLGLSQFEMEVLLLCAALELDTRVAGLCAKAQDDPLRTYPTFALALAAFDNPEWEALSPHRPLRYFRLIEITQPAAQPLTASALRADERIVSYLEGLNILDDRLMNFVSGMEVTPDQKLSESQQVVAEELLARWGCIPPNMSLPIVQLLGADPVSKQLIVTHVAQVCGLKVFRLPAEALPSQIGDLEILARLWQRESALQPIALDSGRDEVQKGGFADYDHFILDHPPALYLDAQELDSAALEQNLSLQRFLARADGIIFLGIRESWQGLPRAYFPIEVDKPTTKEQIQLWTEALGEQFESLAGELAAQFNLNGTTIAQIAHEASEPPVSSSEALKNKVWSSCCARTRPRLDALAQRLDAKATWDDLVLPPEQTALLRQIAGQVGSRHTVYEEWGFAEKMNRGLGISALFEGSSGTGKTMAAEVIANELKLNLYRIDLSAVVSKYIGETEKNLRRLFDAAEDGGAILFFDEADALFGKRSEVKDSHDRYANIEINYLLQRMEAYRGLAILATNMKSALDSAFMRRLRFIVNFPFPGVADRKLIWKRVFPQTEAFKTQLEIADQDYDRLARLNLTGGNIHSIALNAAFAAAQANTKVTLPTLLTAARTEFRKLDKPISETEFR